jgi:hypothetical protein
MVALETDTGNEAFVLPGETAVPVRQQRVPRRSTVTSDKIM